MQLSLTACWMLGMPVGALLGLGLDLGMLGIWCGLGVGVFASALLLNLRLFRSVLRPRQTAHHEETSEFGAAT